MAELSKNELIGSRPQFLDDKKLVDSLNHYEEYRVNYLADLSKNNELGEDQQNIPQ